MFTGIITDIGTVTRIERRGDTRFTINTRFPMQEIAIGASIACSGCCLTVIEKTTDTFTVEASAETLNLTTLKNWQERTRINLERALRMGDELGGHIVSGHVDGMATITSVTPEGDSMRFNFAAPASLAKFIAPKGSVTLDGTSLTVNAVEGLTFGVNIIPHTQAVTTWGQLKSGDQVNLEIDMLARYVARLQEFNT